MVRDLLMIETRNDIHVYSIGWYLLHHRKDLFLEES